MFTPLIAHGDIWTVIFGLSFYAPWAFALSAVHLAINKSRSAKSLVGLLCAVLAVAFAGVFTVALTMSAWHWTAWIVIAGIPGLVGLFSAYLCCRIKEKEGFAHPEL